VLFLPTLGRAVTTITSLLFTMGTSGRYELTGNLAANGTDAIRVPVDNVVIELNGFHLNETNRAGIAITS
jgi:hypothetical protein